MSSIKGTRPADGNQTERMKNVSTAILTAPKRNVKYIGDDWENSYICPICGELLGRRDEVYVDKFGSVLGCEGCIEIRSAEYFCREAEPYDVI